MATFTSLMGADDGCGEPPILDNNGFDLWCGNQLCNWEVESGTVRKSPTWHRSDFGASFDGPIVAMSQLSTRVDSSVDCLVFVAVANIELSASVFVEVDYNDNGTYDVENPIPTSDWARIEFEIATPREFQNARFRIRKEGNGQAVFAELQVDKSDKCSKPPLELPVPAAIADRDRCDDAGDCAEEAPCAIFDPSSGCR